MTEAQLVTKILETLNRVSGVFAWKVVAAPYARKGISDILCVARGAFIALEVKKPDKTRTVTRQQEQFLSQVRRGGGFGYVVTSVDGAMRALTEVIMSQYEPVAYAEPEIETLSDQVFHQEQQAQRIDRPTGQNDSIDEWTTLSGD